MFLEDCGTATLAEISCQARSCRETIQQAQSRLDLIAPLLPVGQYTDILITGCGSSYNLAMCAAFAWSELLARPVAAVAASELMNFPEHYLSADARVLIIAISRSGGTTEVRRAVERLKRDYSACAFAVTGEAGGAVAAVCDRELVFAECYEQSVVMTQAFTCMLVGLYLLADGIAGGGRRAEIAAIPALIGEQFAESERLMRRLAQDPENRRFIFLGSGVMKGLADESALKLTEMAIEPAASCGMLEFRHGRQAALDGGTTVVIFPVAAEAAHLKTLLAEIDATGARAVVITNEVITNEVITNGVIASEVVTTDLSVGVGDSSRHYFLRSRNRLAEIFAAALYAHTAQLLACWRARARRTNPDAPPYLTRTVVLAG